MKWLPLLLAGAATLPPAHAQMDRAELVRIGASVMRVEAARAQGGFALGSAVVVGDGLAVTNCHVTREARAIDLVRGELRWPARMQAADTDHDLCLLRAEGLPAPAVPLGHAEQLQRGQAVVALGFTGGVLLQNSPGEVIGLHRLDGAPVVQTNNRFSSGASGGGLFDADGRLVGILTFRLRGGAHYFAAPSEWLQRLIDGGPSMFHAIAPLPANDRAYWERPQASQPPFLRQLSESE
jgi:serine protease Do